MSFDLVLIICFLLEWICDEGFFYRKDGKEKIIFTAETQRRKEKIEEFITAETQGREGKTNTELNFRIFIEKLSASAS